MLWDKQCTSVRRCCGRCGVAICCEPVGSTCHECSRPGDSRRLNTTCHRQSYCSASKAVDCVVNCGRCRGVGGRNCDVGTELLKRGRVQEIPFFMVMVLREMVSVVSFHHAITVRNMLKMIRSARIPIWVQQQCGHLITLEGHVLSVERAEPIRL